MENPTYPPRLVYDDDCGFCTWCARYAAARGSFEVVGFTELTPDQLARLPDEYEDCAHLLTQTAVYSCGAAIEEAMARVETPSRYLALAFKRLPKRTGLRERGYRVLADNRDLLGKIVRCEPPARQSG